MFAQTDLYIFLVALSFVFSTASPTFANTQDTQNTQFEQQLGKLRQSFARWAWVQARAQQRDKPVYTLSYQYQYTNAVQSQIQLSATAQHISSVFAAYAPSPDPASGDKIGGLCGSGGSGGITYGCGEYVYTISQLYAKCERALFDLDPTKERLEITYFTAKDIAQSIEMYVSTNTDLQKEFAANPKKQKRFAAYQLDLQGVLRSCQVIQHHPDTPATNLPQNIEQEKTGQEKKGRWTGITLDWLILSE